MKKRIFAMLLTLCMVMALLPTAAFAEEVASTETPVIEVATAKELQDAVDYYDSVVVKLVADIVAVDSCALTVPSASVENNNRYVGLDLNGHDISSNADCTIEVQQSATWDIYRDYNWVDIYGEGTIRNTAENAVAICNYGVVTFDARRDEEGNVCSQAPEIFGYVDSYSGEVMIYRGTFHDTVRSCVDEEGFPGRISTEGNGVILNGGITYNFTAADIAESVTGKSAYIRIIGGTVKGELNAVGNATFEVWSGTFDAEVAEEYIVDGYGCYLLGDEYRVVQNDYDYAYLEGLRVIASGGMISCQLWDWEDIREPVFNHNITVPYKTAKIQIWADTHDDRTDLYKFTTIEGVPSTEIAFTEDEVTYEIVVTTYCGYSNTYTLTITREEAPPPPAPVPNNPNKPSTSNRPAAPSTPSTGTVTNPDGSTTTTDRDSTGTKSETTVDKNGVQTTEVTVTNAAIREAVKAGDAVTLPMPAATATKNSASAPSVTVDLPSGVKSARVEIPVANVTVGTVAVIVHADGTEEIIPYSVPTEDGIELTVENGATVKIVDNSRAFNDVSTAHTFSDAVDFASARGIVEGYGNGSFGVGSYATSAATTTVIARIMGEDFYGAGSTAKAQEWAKENGIAAGLDLSGNVTRGDFMVMLWRAASCPAASASDVDFADASGLSATEQAAFAWAVENSVISGYGDGTVRPDANITRGAMAAIAQRYMTR